MHNVVQWFIQTLPLLWPSSTRGNRLVDDPTCCAHAQVSADDQGVHVREFNPHCRSAEDRHAMAHSPDASDTPAPLLEEGDIILQLNGLPVASLAGMDAILEIQRSKQSFMYTKMVAQAELEAAKSESATAMRNLHAKPDDKFPELPFIDSLIVKRPGEHRRLLFRRISGVDYISKQRIDINRRCYIIAILSSVFFGLLCLGLACLASMGLNHPGSSHFHQPTVCNLMKLFGIKGGIFPPLDFNQYSKSGCCSTITLGGYDSHTIAPFPEMQVFLTNLTMCEHALYKAEDGRVLAFGGPRLCKRSTRVQLGAQPDFYGCDGQGLGWYVSNQREGQYVYDILQRGGNDSEAFQRVYCASGDISERGRGVAPNCPCRNRLEPGIIDDISSDRVVRQYPFALTVTIGSENYSYPPSYGFLQEWCYVDRHNCSGIPPPEPTSFFDGGNGELFYSYEACGSVNFFDSANQSSTDGDKRLERETKGSLRWKKALEKQKKRIAKAKAAGYQLPLADSLIARNEAVASEQSTNLDDSVSLSNSHTISAVSVGESRWMLKQKEAKDVPKPHSIAPSWLRIMLKRFTPQVDLGFFILFLVYPGVSSFLFRMFNCQQFDDGSRWLTEDPSISCDTNLFHYMRLYFIFRHRGQIRFVGHIQKELKQQGLVEPHTKYVYLGKDQVTEYGPYTTTQFATLVVHKLDALQDDADDDYAVYGRKAGTDRNFPATSKDEDVFFEQITVRRLGSRDGFKPIPEISELYFYVQSQRSRTARIKWQLEYGDGKGGKPVESDQVRPAYTETQLRNKLTAMVIDTCEAERHDRTRWSIRIFERMMDSPTHGLWVRKVRGNVAVEGEAGWTKLGAVPELAKLIHHGVKNDLAQVPRDSFLMFRSRGQFY
ncbi:MAG: hypothetical protein SGPRY_001427, partial [Prymnesium sp.]